MEHQTPIQSYQGGLSRLYASVTADDMIQSIQGTVRFAPDPQTFRHDIPVLLAEKYREEKERGGDNQIVTRTIEAKYELVAQTIFKSSFKAILQHVQKTEPNFSPKKVNLGYLK